MLTPRPKPVSPKSFRVSDAGRRQKVVGASFRVSDAGRRQKVVGARTRGLQAVIYGDLSFAHLWALNGGTAKRTDLNLDGLFLGAGCGDRLAGSPTSAVEWPCLGIARLLFGDQKADITAPKAPSAFGHVRYGPCRVTASVSRLS